MTSTAGYGDEGGLRELWKRVFHDDERFLDSFFENLFRPEECLVARSGGEGGEVIAMLFMLEGAMSAAAGERPLRYIYACATRPGHRRQGLMGQLLTEAAGRADKEGFDLALVPRTPRLAEYYGRFGFTEPSHLYMRKYPAPAAAKEESAWRTTENKNAAQMLSELRQRFFKGRGAVLWPKAHLKVALGEILARGGEFLVLNGGGGFPSRGGVARSAGVVRPNGYALTIPEGNLIKIIECASTLPQDEMINSLRNHFKTLPTLFSLAGGVCASCAEKPYALLRTRSGGPAPYLNLALDI